MAKKIIFVFLFAITLIIVPAGYAGAAQYYIGVQITSAQAPGNPAGVTDNNYCLPKGTTLIIKDSSDNNPQGTKAISKPICAGDTIWSNLVSLSTGTEYKAYISIGGASPYNLSTSINGYYCPGFWNRGRSVLYNDNGYYGCWVSLDTEKSCGETCSHFGLTYSTMKYQWDSEPADDSYNCATESFLMGASCASCSKGSTYNYYDTITHDCWDSQSWATVDPATVISNISGHSYIQVCRCYTQNASSAVTHDLSFSFFTP